MRCTQAVGSSVTAPNDHNFLSRCGNWSLVDREITFLSAVRPRKIFHCLVDPLEISTFYGEIPPLGCSAREYNGIELLPNFISAYIDADIYPGAELGALLFHLLHASVDMTFFHFELGNAVPQQTADAISPFENAHCVSGASQLLCSCQTSGSAANHSYRLPRKNGGNDRFHPFHFESVINDRHFDLFDRYWVLVNSKYASAFAWRRTEPACELREIVRRV